ncbi:hypothetical protein ACFXPT_31555 [Streptomyces goshikiensis]|uniref:hypothetical protein n=1 Tax=Streptomyces goshikiensis TaxID=1942 RepID=UPI0036CFFBFA
MNSTESHQSAMDLHANSSNLYSDLLNVHQNLTRRIDRMDEDLNNSLDATMELIQSVRLSTDEPISGLGECFAQMFLSLHAKMTAIDTMRQNSDVLAKLIEYREG